MIKIYKITDYKKHGGLKKTAKGLFFNNTDEHSEAKDKYQKIANYIKEDGFFGFTSPYFFTHIIAHHREHGEVRILQDITIGGKELMTSPTKLLETLK